VKETGGKGGKKVVPLVGQLGIRGKKKEKIWKERLEGMEGDRGKRTNVKKSTVQTKKLPKTLAAGKRAEKVGELSFEEKKGGNKRGGTIEREENMGI